MEQDKNFKEFLKTLVEQNKAMLVNELVQTKTDRDLLKIQRQEYNVQSESVEKTLSQSKKLLEKIEKHLVKSGEVYKKTNDKIVGKLDNLGKLDKAPQSKIQAERDTRPLTFKEQLQQKVASVKGIGGSIARGVGAIGRTVSSPIKSAQSLGSSVQDKIYSGIEQSVGFVGDVLGTKEGFDVKKQRYAQAQLASSKLATDESRGTVTAKENVLSFKEKEFAAIQKLTKKIEELEKVKEERKPYGAGLSEQEQSEYESLASRRSKIEERGSKSIDARYKSGQEKLEESDSQKEAEKNAEVKRQENPESDNIVSAQEKLSDTAKEDLQLTKQLLDTTKESVTILKDIRQSLADQIEPLRSKEKPIVPQEAANDSSGGSLLGSAADALSNLPGRGAPGKSTPKPTGKPSLGGRIMGGLKRAGPGLLKGGAGAIGGMALGYGAEKLIESGHEKVGGALDVGAEALSGAGMGAMIGSVVPGIGTGIGAAIGGVAGGAYGLYKNFGNIFGSDKKQDGVQPSSTTREGLLIADQPFVPGQPLTQEQMAVIGMSKSMGNNYPPEVEAQYSKQLEGRAKGGPVEDGSDYIVGEKGPELFMPFKDGMVIPNDKSKKIIDGKIGLAEGGVAFANQIDTSLTSGLKSKQDAGYEISPWIGGVQRTKSSTGAQTIQGQVGGVDTTTEKDIYGNVRGRRSSTTLGDISTEMGYLQAGSTPAYATVKGPDGQLVPGLGQDLLELSTENKDLERGSGSSGSSQPIVINNSSNNATTKVMPMKADPRPSSRGSALDRHIDRVSTY